jgi:hypothetical protein
MGRWISADPLAIQIPGGADPNLYAYVRGAILKNVDPLGLQDANANSNGGTSGDDRSMGGSQGAGPLTPNGHAIAVAAPPPMDDFSALDGMQAEAAGALIGAVSTQMPIGSEAYLKGAMEHVRGIKNDENYAAFLQGVRKGIEAGTLAGLAAAAEAAKDGAGIGAAGCLETGGAGCAVGVTVVLAASLYAVVVAKNAAAGTQIVNMSSRSVKKANANLERREAVQKGPGGAKKHNPSPAHQNETAKKKHKERFQKKQEQKRKATEEQEESLLEEWNGMSDDAQKIYGDFEKWKQGKLKNK